MAAIWQRVKKMKGVWVLSKATVYALHTWSAILVHLRDTSWSSQHHPVDPLRKMEATVETCQGMNVRDIAATLLSNKCVRKDEVWAVTPAESMHWRSI